MESLYHIHHYLLKNLKLPLRRQIMDEIDWNNRLIAIKGFGGSGKTSVLIQYAQENYSPSDRRCLYINLNNLYFSVKTISDFANEFRIKGGELLLIDQIFKYPNWEEELLSCYEKYPDLKIVFTCPSVLPLDKNPDLKEKITAYEIGGFSFREYIELQTGLKFSSYTLEDILSDHEEIVLDIISKTRPLAYIEDYLRHGFCPFHMENHNFVENLSKRINTMLDVDLLAINQIEQSYLPKIKKLLYLLSLSSPCSPNISQLSIDISTSRATVMNYIKSLEDSKIINLLYNEGEEFPKKPAQIYINNPNLLYATHLVNIDEQILRETFFYNQIGKNHPVNLGKKNCQFTVDGKYNFNIGNNVRGKFNPETYYAISGIENGEKRVIPLWLFGFLY